MILFYSNWLGYVRTSEAPDAPCVMEISCEKPFCGIFGGKRYHENEQVVDTAVCSTCEICFCRKGEVNNVTMLYSIITRLFENQRMTSRFIVQTCPPHAQHILASHEDSLKIPTWIESAGESFATILWIDWLEGYEERIAQWIDKLSKIDRTTNANVFQE